MCDKQIKDVSDAVFLSRLLLKEGMLYGSLFEDFIIRGYLLVYFDIHVEQGKSRQEVENRVGR